MIEYMLSKAFFQFDRSIEGILGESAEVRLHPSTKSARETVMHLCEVYEAFICICRGAKYQWGSLTFADTSLEGATIFMNDLRSKAAALAISAESEKIAHAAIEYLGLHTAFHAGQMCSLHRFLDPEWDFHRIYKV